MITSATALKQICGHWAAHTQKASREVAMLGITSEVVPGGLYTASRAQPRGFSCATNANSHNGSRQELVATTGGIETFHRRLYRVQGAFQGRVLPSRRCALHGIQLRSPKHQELLADPLGPCTVLTVLGV